MEVTRFDGGCLCGAVRYVATARPLVTRVCWCRVCQYLAAGNATVNLAFPRKSVTVTGEVRRYLRISDSGNHLHGSFCPTCGTPMFSEAEERPHIIVVRAGTLDRPNDIKLEAEIWVTSAPEWARLNPELAHFDGQPPAPVVKE